MSKDHNSTCCKSSSLKGPWRWWYYDPSKPW